MTDIIIFDYEYVNTFIEQLKNQYDNYFYVFTSCQKKWIIILEKIKDTMTDESRDDIFDFEYAKFRGNKFKVIKIINKFDINKELNEITNSYDESTINYKVNEIAEGIFFDGDLNIVYSYGIHYF